MEGLWRGYQSLFGSDRHAACFMCQTRAVQSWNTSLFYYKTEQVAYMTSMRLDRSCLSRKDEVWREFHLWRMLWSIAYAWPSIKEDTAGDVHLKKPPWQKTGAGQTLVSGHCYGQCFPRRVNFHANYCAVAAKMDADVDASSWKQHWSAQHCVSVVVTVMTRLLLYMYYDNSYGKCSPTVVMKKVRPLDTMFYCTYPSLIKAV